MNSAKKQRNGRANVVIQQALQRSVAINRRFYLGIFALSAGWSVFAKFLYWPRVGITFWKTEDGRRKTEDGRRKSTVLTKRKAG
ncbi:hypothetical protein [Mixta sp. Marseille-Q2659]|uniref:hypothetical protein n=1 Tax=Mixta sp. Marseille-Q2659 TaxID=2736607 RepID=UPI0023B9E125|nr:hypothetical protein [Mixta sp. Marseille-Q2659]